MRQEKILRNLEIVTNAAILLVAVLIVGTFASRYFMKPLKPSLSGGLQVGQTFSNIEGITYQDSPKTLLIAVSAKCTYCISSIPFYERLAEAQRANPSTRIVQVFPSFEDVKALAGQKGSMESRTVDFRSLGLTSTPTMILLDNDGRVLNFWVGQLSPQRETEVLKAAGFSET